MTAIIPTEQIRIIEYDPSYAGAVAEMWNRSNESWGAVPTTEQKTVCAGRWRFRPIFMCFSLSMAKGGRILQFCTLPPR